MSRARRVPIAQPLSEREVRADVRKIKSIYIVVHTMGPVSDIISDNHWSVYLVLDSVRDSSVRLNMIQLQDEDPTGTLQWSWLPYIRTTSAIKTFPFPTIDGLCVCHVAEMIYQQGRHRYSFSGGGSGCRAWVSVQKPFSQCVD